MAGVTGPTYAEVLAQLTEIYKPLPPPITAIALATVDDVAVFRDRIGAEPVEPMPGPLSLLSIPVIVDETLPPGVMEIRSGDSVRRFRLYGFETA